MLLWNIVWYGSNNRFIGLIIKLLNIGLIKRFDRNLLRERGKGKCGEGYGINFYF